MVCRGRWTEWILSSLALRLLGVVSFSLCLFHVMVMRHLGVEALGLSYGNEPFLVTLAATWLVACVVYPLVERPFLRLRSF